MSVWSSHSVLLNAHNINALNGRALVTCIRLCIPNHRGYFKDRGFPVYTIHKYINTAIQPFEILVNWIVWSCVYDYTTTPSYTQAIQYTHRARTRPQYLTSLGWFIEILGMYFNIMQSNRIQFGQSNCRTQLIVAELNLPLNNQLKVRPGQLPDCSLCECAVYILLYFSLPSVTHSLTWPNLLFTCPNRASIQ